MQKLTAVRRAESRKGTTKNIPKPPHGPMPAAFTPHMESKVSVSPMMGQRKSRSVGQLRVG
jgi:hypothetical protein